MAKESYVLLGQQVPRHQAISEVGGTTKRCYHYRINAEGVVLPGAQRRPQRPSCTDVSFVLLLEHKFGGKSLGHLRQRRERQWLRGMEANKPGCHAKDSSRDPIPRARGVEREEVGQAQGHPDRPGELGHIPTGRMPRPAEKHSMTTERLEPS